MVPSGGRLVSDRTERRGAAGLVGGAGEHHDAGIPETEAFTRFAQNADEVGRFGAGQAFAELQVATHHSEQLGAGLLSRLDQALGHGFAKDSTLVAHGSGQVAMHGDRQTDCHVS